MKLYIASRFRNKPRIRLWVENLPRYYEVVSSWHQLEDAEDMDYAKAVARDLYEIDLCDAVVVITHDCEAVPGGMHFEAGYAYARGKKVYLLGPAVNVFYRCIAEAFPW